MTAPRFFVVFLVCWSLAGCAAPDGSTIGAEPSTTIDSQEDTTSMPEATEQDDNTFTIDRAMADLSTRLGVDTSEIELVKIEAVTWSDGSLGCPEDGKTYTQALVDGRQVVLAHDGRLFDYRSGDDGIPRLCPSSAKDGGHEFVPPPRLDD